MAFNQFMHPRNRYKDRKPDFAQLAEKYPEFAKHVSVNLAGTAALDFHDPQSLRALTCTLLKEDFGLSIDLPLDRLIPTVSLRLNYIHWIEDLLQESGHSSNICGIDIGCGASCIYPLLGCQMNQWCFTASEIDDLARQYACENVKRNNLQDQIKVLAPPKDTLIQGVFKAAPQSLYHFTMCNPPFFGNAMEAQGIMSSRTLCRPEPRSVSTASEVEMIYEEGGEVDFVKRMIVESLQLREQIVWYTSMLGKKSSLGPLKEELRKQQIRNFTTTEFCQGRTMRWGIAWTFYDDITAPPPSKRRKFKQRPPLVMLVPARFVDKAVTSGSTSPGTTKGHAEKVQAVTGAIKQMLKDLQISFEVKQSSRKVVKLECTALTNTWAHQRRKRRQRKRLQHVAVPSTTPGDNGTNVVKIAPGSADCDQTQSPSMEIKPVHNFKDSTRSVSGSSEMEMPVPMATELATLGCASERNQSEQSQKVLSLSSNTKDSNSESSQNMSEFSSSSSVVDSNSAESSSSSTVQECVQTIVDKTKVGLAEEIGPNGNPKNLLDSGKEHGKTTECIQSTSDKVAGQTLQGPGCFSSTIEVQAKEAGLGELKSSSESKTVAEPLLKCALFVKMVEDKMSVELSWLDGSSREAMHQVGQFIRNQLAK